MVENQGKVDGQTSESRDQNPELIPLYTWGNMSQVGYNLCRVPLCK